MEKSKERSEVKRIGILVVGIDVKIMPVLQYLTLHMNSLQSAFEYEFLPGPQDEFLDKLSSKESLDREELRSQVKDFVARYSSVLHSLIKGYKLEGTIPDRFVILSLASFIDNYYTMRQGNLSVIALGKWDKVMAPPSIMEFMLTLIVRESVAVVSPSLRGSIHIGTKGCLEDFTPLLADARYKVLNAFICHHCREALEHDGFPTLADELLGILNKKWLGDPNEPNSPANISKKLGYNLFTTSGFESTSREKFMNLVQEESTKQVVNIIGAILVAILILILGLR
jgi:hypothetical protein